MAFQKGQSGNPGGRPKESDEVKALARQYTPEAIERLAFWMRSENAKASVSACSSLIDRAWGKPVQSMEHSGHDGGPIETSTDPRSLALAVVDLLRQTKD
jgi:hypothetical protein